MDEQENIETVEDTEVIAPVVEETPIVEGAPVVPDFTAYQAATEERIRLERENAELKAKIPAPETKAKDEDPMPDPADYEGRELEFTRDLNRWDARKTAREEFTRLQQAAEHSAKEQSAQNDIQKAKDNYNTLLQAEIQTTPGLAKAIQSANIPLTEGRDYFIAKSPYAGKIAKHLAMTPGELGKYAAMPVDEALIYIGELQAKFKGETKTPEVSKAPAPHPKIEGAAAGAAGKYKAGDGPDAYLRQFYPEMFE